MLGLAAGEAKKLNLEKDSRTTVAMVTPTAPTKDSDTGVDFDIGSTESRPSCDSGMGEMPNVKPECQ